jgi:hypothetical protein
MSRKITTGIVGRAVLGSLTTDNNSLQSVVTNANVLLEPNGTGIVQSTRDLQINAQNSLRLADSDSSNYVALRAPTTVASNVTLTLPNSAGSSGQGLLTDGAGNLSWGPAGVTVTNRSAADSSTYYVAMTDQTSGAEDVLSVASDRMTFVPNPGRLTVSYLTVTSDFQAATITETSSIALKENVQPISNALDKILKLEGVHYTRKATGKYETGLIAEEVEKIAPELVDSNGEFKSIQYTRITAYLIECVKNLQKEIKVLQEKS